MTTAIATASNAVERPVAQTCVLVLPSTDEYDSRTYRIARSLHERGHHVTVVARWKSGLARRELHPVGYAILRVEAGAADALPLPGLWRWALARLRRLRPAAAADAKDGVPIDEPPRDPPGSGRGGPRAHLRRVAGYRRQVFGYARRARLFLMIHGHRRRALELAPAADIYHGMAYMGIPVALALRSKHGGWVVYDSRDIYLLAANLARLRGPIKWLLAWLERRWARRADRVVTVNRPYAEQLGKRFGVPTPAIVMNCSYRFDPPDPPRRRFHAQLDLAPETKIVLYHGGFSRGRGVEQLVEAIQQVPGAVLVVMGYGTLEESFRAVANEPRNVGRVFVLPAVPPTELLAWVASADVVGILIQNDTINHYLSTPNKLFEAMAAGVPCVVSDHPGMAPIVRETGCGLAVDPADVTAIGDAIRAILSGSPEERAAWRGRCLAAAHSTYNWETQVEALLDEYGRLTKRPW